MTHDEMTKFAYETMIKNNPDEALKVLIMQDKKIKELEKINFDILEKYLKEIHSIIDKYDDDSELLHIKFDDLLLNFIDELGYHQIVELYLLEKNNFWYA